jgi:hypothetical protein
LIFSQVLYQLSYRGNYKSILAQLSALVKLRTGVCPYVVRDHRSMGAAKRWLRISRRHRCLRRIQ